MSNGGTAMKKCEWCKKMFEATGPYAGLRKFCNSKCKDKKKKNSPQYKEAEHRRQQEWRLKHPDYQKEHRAKSPGLSEEIYDKNFLYYEQWRKEHPDKLKEYAERHREKNNERRRIYRAQAAARAAYLADPVNAKRIEEANLARMTPEERAKWDEKLDKELERRDRKELRDAIRAELKIAERAATAKDDPTWADLEWSPETGTK